MIHSTQTKPARPNESPADGQLAEGQMVAPLLLKSADAAKALAISKRKLWEMTTAGEIPHVKIGRHIRYSVEALHDWIKSQLVTQ